MIIQQIAEAISPQKALSLLLEQKPVIIRSISGFPHDELWNLAFLSRRYGDLVLSCRHSATHLHPDLRTKASIRRPDVKLGEAEALLKESTGTVFLGGDLLGVSWGAYQLTAQRLCSDFGLPQVIPIDSLLLVGLWLSPIGVRSWLHYDENEAGNLNIQIEGRKEITVLSPEFADLGLMCVDDRFRNFSEIDIEQPDYRKYPMLNKVKAFKGFLRSGDAAYIPPRWLHSFAHCGEVNVNISFWWKPPASITESEAASRFWLTVFQRGGSDVSSL